MWADPLGFVGVWSILKPAAGDFNFYALSPLISVILFALAMILTRTKCRNEHPLILSLALNISFVMVGLLASLLILPLGQADTGATARSFLVGSWTAMGFGEWAAMTLLAMSILIGSIGAAIAYQTGPSSIVATCDFAYVGFAAVWGLVFFGEVTDRIALLGMLMIIGTGILTVRKRRLWIRAHFSLQSLDIEMAAHRSKIGSDRSIHPRPVRFEALCRLPGLSLSKHIGSSSQASVAGHEKGRSAAA